MRPQNVVERKLQRLAPIAVFFLDIINKKAVRNASKSGVLES